MKSLIITADDVGLHPGMTAGAIRAHREGIVTACSVVANGSAFADAVERLQEVPTLAVGVHLTLVEERPIAKGVDSLVGSDGRFFRSYSAFLPRYLARTIRIADIDRELRAQVEAVMHAGLEVVHLNGHQHLHLLPRIFDVVQKIAADYRIGYIRIVDDRGGRAPLARRAAVAGLSVLGRRARRRASAASNDRTIGVAGAGHLSVDSIIRLLDEVRGVTELVVHPGIGGASLASTYAWRYEWDAETAALCDPRVKDAIHDGNVSLTAMRETFPV